MAKKKNRIGFYVLFGDFDEDAGFIQGSDCFLSLSPWEIFVFAWLISVLINSFLWGWNKQMG